MGTCVEGRSVEERIFSRDTKCLFFFFFFWYPGFPSLFALFWFQGALLSSVVHPKILRLAGVCFDVLPYLVITEYMRNGDLKTYLRNYRLNRDTGIR